MRLPSKSSLRGHAAMLAFSILVSVSFVAGLRIANQIDPSVITFVRFVIAAAFIAIIITFQKQWEQSKLLSIWRSAILGTLIAIYFVTMFEGLKTASSTSMSVVFTLTPLLAGFFDFHFSGTRMSRKVWGIVAFSALGAIWIIFDGELKNIKALNIGFGEKLFFMGCICHAIYAALIPKLNRGEPAIIQTFGTLVAGIFIVGFFSIGELSITLWSNINIFAVLTIIYLAIFATAISFFLIQYSAIRLSSIKVMAYTYAIPIWVVFSEMLILGGSLDFSILIGALIISICLILLLLNNEM